MVAKAEKKKPTKKMTENERYLHAVFSVLKRMETIVIADKKARFNDTEFRLLSEVLAAKCEGDRLISTQLAKRLGVTRSAISQIVNRLEKDNIVRRVPDEVDKKIAYIEMTDETMAIYSVELKASKQFIGKVVKKFGADRFDGLCSLINEFMDTLETEKEINAKKKK